MVPNTSELLPEPETPVNTVSRRFGSSRLTSLRLFTRAPCTRIRSWLSATCSAGDCVSVLVALLIVSPSVGRGRLGGLRRRRLARSDQLRAVRLVLLRFGPWNLWAPATRRARRGVRPTSGRRASARRRAARSPRARPGCGAGRSAGAGGRHSTVLKQPEDVAIGVGDGGHQAAATDVVRGLLHGGTRGGHLGQLHLEVRHVPVRHPRGPALRSTARPQPDTLARRLAPDVGGRVSPARYPEPGRG